MSRRWPRPRPATNIVAALNEGDWDDKTVVVRVNDRPRAWAYRDVIEVVEGAGDNLDCIMLPKVQTAGEVELARPAADAGRETTAWTSARIGIEAQIENAPGPGRTSTTSRSRRRASRP